MSNELHNGGDPCMWLCFPCLFVITTCEVFCRACCITICCIKPYSINSINSDDFQN